MSDIIIRSVILAVVLLILTRIMGKRVVGELSAVDFVTGITLGTIAGSISVQRSLPLWGGVAALVVWTTFEWVNAKGGMMWSAYRKATTGTVTVLVEDGKIIRKSLKKADMSEGTLLSELRAREIANLKEVKKATLEPSGKIGIEKASQKASSEQSGSASESSEPLFSPERLK